MWKSITTLMMKFTQPILELQCLNFEKSRHSFEEYIIIENIKGEKRWYAYIH